MKPIDVKTSTYIDFEAKSNHQDLDFEVGDHIRTSKYNNIFAKRLYSKLL